MLFVFFVKQKAAYVMRIIDWSSDVCSSDLKRFSASVTSGGHSTPVVTGFGRPASATLQVARSNIPTFRVSASVAACDAWTRRHCRPSGCGFGGFAADSSRGAPGHPGFGSSGLAGSSLPRDRKRGVGGKSVSGREERGGRRTIKKKKKECRCN